MRFGCPQILALIEQDAKQLCPDVDVASIQDFPSQFAAAMVDDYIRETEQNRELFGYEIKTKYFEEMKAVNRLCHQHPSLALELYANSFPDADDLEASGLQQVIMEQLSTTFGNIAINGYNQGDVTTRQKMSAMGLHLLRTMAQPIGYGFPPHESTTNNNLAKIYVTRLQRGMEQHATDGGQLVRLQPVGQQFANQFVKEVMQFCAVEEFTPVEQSQERER